ncbi:MAG: response regulator [Bacteroidales bacterium]|nr:response regulator [Bacteroidales bacterium]
MRFPKVFATLAAATLLAASSGAAVKERHYTIKDGLADSSPRHLTQDSNGTLWISTWGGISMFDGGSFESVDARMGTFFGTTSMVAEAGGGVYWVCGFSGIHMIDLNNGGIRSFQIGYDRARQSISDLTMAVSGSGEVFCSSFNWGICHYNPIAGEMVPINIYDVNTNKITDILCVGQDKLAILEDTGVLSIVSYTSSDGSISIHGTQTPLKNQTVSGIFKIDDGLALVTEDNKIMVWDSGNSSISTSYPIPAGLYANGAGKSGSSLAAIAYRDAKTFEIDLADGSIREIDELKGKNVYCLYYGTEDILWAGINGGGLLALWNDTSGMDKFLNNEVFGDRVGNVSSFFELPGEGLLVSTEGNGIYSLRKDGSLKTISMADGLGNDKVYVMERAIGDDIFIGHEGLGINVLSGGKISSLLSDEFNIRNIYTIRRDDKMDCWYLGAYDLGISRLRVGKGPGGKYSVKELKLWYFDDPDSYSGKSVTDIIPLGDGRLIVGTLTEGCLVFDTATGRFLDYQICPDAVLSLYLEDESSLWIGTGGQGLRHIVRKGENDYETTVYGKDNGLIDLSIHSILKDSAGRIWVSTNRGISSIDPSTGEIDNYHGNDDLQSDEFSNSASIATSDGTFCFGGVEGFNRFNPLRLEKRDFEPEVRISRLSLIQDPDRVIPANGEVVFKHNENYFSIYYSAVEFIENANCEYSYRLAGFDEQWIHLAKSSPVTYTNIPHGKYRFEIRCTNGDRKWSSKVAALEITVRRPWWNTWWAYLIYGCAALALALLMNRLTKERLRRKREMELEILNKQHENETYEAKLRFFTNIAHEFGTPLTLISGAGERLMETGQLSSKPAKYVGIIKDNADRMLRLIKELMDFRKVDTGNYPLTYSKFDIAKLSRDICLGYSGQGETAMIGLELEISEEPVWIVSDYGAVEKILHNLVSNAYKYTPEQGLINVSLNRLEDNSVRLTVTNSGKGIKPEDLPKVFDRFVVLENLESEAREGRIVRNGVGLALVSSLVNTLGGEISVSSERKKFTEFTVTLPSAENQALREDDTSLSPELYGVQNPMGEDNYTAAGSNETILIVDDEKAIRDLVSDILGDRYTVLQASDGKEAVEIISHGLPDLVITDIAMPGMNGIELCKYLKENEITKNIPIVFLSFLSDIQNEISTYETGGEAFIPKPFYPRHLNAVVGKILSGRESLKSFYSSAISNSDFLNEKVVSKEDKDFILKITGLIEADLSNEEISPAFLSEQMNISKSQLYRKLKELVDLSPVEFVRSIRLEKAAHMLKTTTLTVQEIMYSVGFNNKSYFYREFGKKYGASPKEYRMSE